MNILFTGNFDPEYNRTKIIIKGLKSLGAEISILNYSKKAKPEKSKLQQAIDKADWIFLPSFTHTDLPYIRKITSKPIIFDPLISRYLSKVFDYKSVSKYSPRAYKNYLKDSRALKRADIILADTQSHKNYYIQKFGISEKKIKVVPIGVIREDFFPISVNSEIKSKTVVGFYGSFIPLHGIDIIIEAAEILKNNTQIRFKLIGDGVLMNKMKKLANSKKLENIEFSGWKSYSELNEEINNFDIALGIFGSSKKAKMVIPNKLFHYAACEKVIISRKSEAITEIFDHNNTIYLCDPDSKSLSDAILDLEDKSKREQIAENAKNLITKEYNDMRIADKILNIILDYPRGS